MASGRGRSSPHGSCSPFPFPLAFPLALAFSSQSGIPGTERLGTAVTGSSNSLGWRMDRSTTGDGELGTVVQWDESVLVLVLVFVFGFVPARRSSAERQGGRLDRRFGFPASLV